MHCKYIKDSRLPVHLLPEKIEAIITHWTETAPSLIGMKIYKSDRFIYGPVGIKIWSLNTPPFPTPGQPFIVRVLE